MYIELKGLVRVSYLYYARHSFQYVNYPKRKIILIEFSVVFYLVRAVLTLCQL
jgi:hypothetical protein